MEDRVSDYQVITLFWPINTPIDSRVRLMSLPICFQYMKGGKIVHKIRLVWPGYKAMGLDLLRFELTVNVIA